MAEIRPFAGLRYAEKYDLSRVTCPPYDVLSVPQRAALADRSPVAAVRFILPDGDDDAKYRNAAVLLDDWRARGVLLPDPEPGLYVQRSAFTVPGTADERRHTLGLICLLRLHDYADRVVLPHEKTLSKPREDRLNLLRATRTNTESIMALAEDARGGLLAALNDAASAPPVADFAGDDDQRHTLWRVTDDAAVGRVASLLADQQIFIADGHHRYETSLAYARETGALGTDRPEAFILVTLLSLADPGLVVLPTHRLVRGTPPERLEATLRNLGERFEARRVGTETELEAALNVAPGDAGDRFAFGLAVGGHLWHLTAHSPAALDAALPAEVAPSVRRLDVARLQHVVLDAVLGIPAGETATTDRLAYTRDFHEAVAKAAPGGGFDAALLLARPTVEGMLDVSRAGEVMPQKSTFFYPKLVSGLVARRMDG